MAERASSAPATTLSQPALESWGRGVGEAVVSGALELPLVLALRGPLGAGKSVLARSIARGAGVVGPMPSPTYNLLYTYTVAAAPAGGVDDELRVHHLDLYRLEHPDDIWELGWEELGQGEDREIVLVEWPERAGSLLPPDRWEVRLGFPDDGGAAGDPDAAGGRAGGTHPVDVDAGFRTLRIESLGGAPEPPPLPPRERPLPQSRGRS